MSINPPLLLRRISLWRRDDPDRVPLFAPVSIEIAAGSFSLVRGPSGVGKSALLAAIAGVPAPVFQLAGQVLLGGRELSGLPPQKRRIGLMFQQDLLFPHFTATENIAFGLPVGLSRRARHARAKAILAAVDMAAFAARYPDQLSGGQRTRIALLRALAAEPDAILLDEPFAHLDPVTRAQLRDWTVAQITARAIPALLVSHDREDSDIATGPGLVLSATDQCPDR